MAFESPNETGGTILIDLHYRELGLDKGWDNQRVNRLCQWLQVTPYELGKLACLDFGSITRYLNADRFPPTVSLHFAIIESWYLETVLGLPQKPLVPIHALL